LCGIETRLTRNYFSNIDPTPLKNNTSYHPSFQKINFLFVWSRYRSEEISPLVGKRFKGGYHVEKNPITGGYKLVEPAKGK
jgi:hypothetical protein